MTAAFGYVDGYKYGQHDALTWLEGVARKDSTLAAFDPAVQMRASLVCLAHNLQIAAGLCRAFDLGVESCFTYCEHWYGPDGWKPGCGREAPR